MNILMLGGTQFSGRSCVMQAVQAGHQVTVLHRSKADPGLPSSVRRIVGDRDPALGDGLAQIHAIAEKGERFDAVVDMCGYVPRVVQASCDLLNNSTDIYIYISSVSVYERSADATPDEDSPVITLEDPTVEEVTSETYGGLKVLCERVVDQSFGNRACIVRPGLIAGPNDPTDRFTWWVRVLASEEAVLVPAEPAGLVSFIDARDLAAFFLTCAANQTTGVFNAVGPEVGLGFGTFLDRAKAALKSKTRLLACAHDWLAGHEVKPWQSLPFWLPAESQSMHRVSGARARSKGLLNRSLEETVRDTHAWDCERNTPTLKAGLAIEQLRELVRMIET